MISLPFSTTHPLRAQKIATLVSDFWEVVMVGFGKPIIAGTGISTAIIASRFNARESIGDLAAEYDFSPKQVEEAIRWERAIPVAA